MIMSERDPSASSGQAARGPEEHDASPEWRGLLMWSADLQVRIMRMSGPGGPRSKTRHWSGAPPAKRLPPLSAEEIQARVLHRDGLVLVIDKPAGLAVHAGPSKAPNLEECFDALRFGLPRPPALAHRLDADTSGVLVLGRHPKALSKLFFFNDTATTE